MTKWLKYDSLIEILAYLQGMQTNIKIFLHLFFI